MEMETEIEHKTIEINKHEFHYFVSGNNEGKTILFLHPAFGDHRCFDNQIDFFAKNYRIITIDLLGHGKTGIGKTKDKIAHSSEHILKILDTEQVNEIHIVGVSLGSLLAQDFALQNPEKVLSLTALGGYNIHWEQKEIAKAQQKEMFKWLFKMIFSMDSFRKYVSTVSVDTSTGQEKYYESARHFTRKSFTVMSGLDKIIAERRIEQNYPLLILVGEKDNELAIKSAGKWHEDVSQSRFETITNAGHCANMDNASEFNEILFSFLTSSEQKR